MSMPKFSVVLIARNEEETLPRLLESLTEFRESGGQVVVLDTGSSDDTITVARLAGCLVYEVGDRFTREISKDLEREINAEFTTFKELAVLSNLSEEPLTVFDFSAARNYAATLASSDFVWMPDCDEVFTKFDLQEIDEAISGGARRLEYNFVYCHDQYGAESIKFIHSKAYDRTRFRWTGIIHEVLTNAPSEEWHSGVTPTTPEVMRSEFKTVSLSEDMVKLEHFQNPSTPRNSYLVGLALDCHNNPGPDNDRNWHYFGRELLWSGRPKSAILVLCKHISMKKWPTESAQSAIYIGDAHLALGDAEAAKTWWHRAFIVDESRREPLMRLATQAWREHDAQRTAAYCAAALTISSSNFYANDTADYAQRPHELMYWAMHWMGDMEAAAVHWRCALAYCPTNPKYLYDGRFYLQNPELDIDQFTDAIIESRPFSFVKMGDGELACMRGDTGATCDGQVYSPGLAEALRGAYQRLVGRVHVVHFDHQSDFNMLLHRDDQPTAPVVNFWSEVRDSGRPKAFVGPPTIVGGLIKLLGTGSVSHNYVFEVPGSDAFSAYDKTSRLLRAWASLEEDPIIVFCAGPVSKVLIDDVLGMALGSDDVTCIDAGSSFDPMFIGQTRTHQLTGDQMRLAYGLPSEVESSVVQGELPWVSIVIPTMCRRQQLDKLLTLIDKNVGCTNYEVVVEHDWPYNRAGCPRTLARGVERAKYELVMFLGNDTEPQPGFLREAVQCMVTHFPNLDGLVGLNDGASPLVASHWLAGRKLLDLIGDTEFFHTGYNHVGCDNELTARARQVGKYTRCDSAKIIHNHGPSVGKTDLVYELGWNASCVTADRKLLQRRADQVGFRPWLVA